MTRSVSRKNHWNISIFGTNHYLTNVSYNYNVNYLHCLKKKTARIRDILGPFQVKLTQSMLSWEYPKLRFFKCVLHVEIHTNKHLEDSSTVTVVVICRKRENMFKSEYL